MLAEPLQFCLYHGTTVDKGQSILVQQKFLPSSGNRHWLGDGIYFFEQEKDAVQWVEKYGEYVVLETNLSVPPERFFDLLNENQREAFEYVMETILDNAEQHNLQISRKDKIDGYVINFMCNVLNFPIDIVKAAFYFENDRFRRYIEKYGASPTRMRVAQIQYCLRNERCIIEIRKKVERAS